MRFFYAIGKDGFLQGIPHYRILFDHPPGPQANVAIQKIMEYNSTQPTVVVVREDTHPLTDMRELFRVFTKDLREQFTCTIILETPQTPDLAYDSFDRVHLVMPFAEYQGQLASEIHLLWREGDGSIQYPSSLAKTIPIWIHPVATGLLPKLLEWSRIQPVPVRIGR